MKYLTFFTSLLLCVCVLCAFVPTKANAEIYESTVRLHVIASSDDEKDQAAKLAVRDAALEKINELISGCKNAAETENAIAENLDTLCDIANKTLSGLGCDDRCEAVLSHEYYPEKQYDEVFLPAGVYPSLQLKIGKADGHNWWCVLFPQLSLGAATKEVLIRTGFSPDQIDVLTGGDRVDYKLKFKIWEIFRK